MKKLPRLISLSMTLLLLFLIPVTLLRIAFWKYFESPADPLSLNIVLQSLYIGFKFDLRLSLLIILPFILLAFIKPLSPFHSKTVRLFWSGYFTLASFLLVLFYIIDFGHFAYLNVRLDSTAISLLEDAAISFEMVWETYPVLRIILGLIIVTALYAVIIYRLILKHSRKNTYHSRNRWQRRIVATLYICLIIFGIYGKVSYYPLRWSDAFFSTNAFASAVALNPVLYFYDTIKAGGIRYDEAVVKEHYEEMAEYLGVHEPDKERLNFVRQINSTPEITTRPNIVMVFLESFSYYKTGLYGNPIVAAPNFKSIAQKGIFFDHFYTPHWGTARSVFTAITGIPDVELNNTSSRNPMIVCQHTIVNAFEGYEKFYFLGGSASWGNIRGLLSHNIPGLHPYEEGSFKSPRVDVWGISDLALFKEANEVLRQNQDRPFFAIIQTAGNHRPYTIPEDNHNFEILSQNPDVLKKNGFESVEEFNAFRFLDHSVGVFMEMARQEKYFSNTIFVFFGDHGIRGDGGDYTPKAEAQLGLTGFHVPLVIYAPALIPEGRRYSMPATEPDILPTIAGLTLNSYANTTLGRDLLDTGFDTDHYAFIIVHSSIPEISILDEKFYFLMSANGTNKRLHILDSDTPRENVLTQFPAEAAEMEQQLRGIHETSKYMLYHNACK